MRLTPAHFFALQVPGQLRKVAPDAVLSLHYLDAFAASLSGQHETTYYVTGVPTPAHLPRVPPDRYLLRAAIQRADRLAVPSIHVRQALKEYYGRDSKVLPVPVDTAAFCPSASESSQRETMLAVGAFDDPRKGIEVLFRAFGLVKRKRVEARLVVSGQLSVRRQQECLALLSAAAAKDVSFLGPGNLEDLPALYRRAAVTVLPSMNEAYGLVLLESMACGTPVVATRHAALPEIVQEALTGVLFDPGDPNASVVTDEVALSDALLEGLELAELPETASRCVEGAAPYGWDRLGSQYADFFRRGAKDGQESRST